MARAVRPLADTDECTRARVVFVELIVGEVGGERGGWKERGGKASGTQLLEKVAPPPVAPEQTSPRPMKATVAAKRAFVATLRAPGVVRKVAEAFASSTT